MSEDLESLGIVLPVEQKPDAETMAAQKQWLEDGTVSESYVQSLQGSASSIELPDASELVAANLKRRLL